MTINIYFTSILCIIKLLFFSILNTNKRCEYSANSNVPSVLTLMLSVIYTDTNKPMFSISLVFQFEEPKFKLTIYTVHSY